MNTIQKAMERQEFEHNLAVAWNDGHYTDSQAKLSAEVQGLNWANITIVRSRLYEIEQCANEGYYHGTN